MMEANQQTYLDLETQAMNLKDYENDPFEYKAEELMIKIDKLNQEAEELIKAFDKIDKAVEKLDHSDFDQSAMNELNNIMNSTFNLIQKLKGGE